MVMSQFCRKITVYEHVAGDMSLFVGGNRSMGANSKFCNFSRLSVISNIMVLFCFLLGNDHKQADLLSCTSVCRRA